MSELECGSVECAAVGLLLLLLLLLPPAKCVALVSSAFDSSKSANPLSVKDLGVELWPGMKPNSTRKKTAPSRRRAPSRPEHRGMVHTTGGSRSFAGTFPALLLRVCRPLPAGESDLSSNRWAHASVPGQETPAPYMRSGGEQTLKIVRVVGVYAGPAGRATVRCWHELANASKPSQTRRQQLSAGERAADQNSLSFQQNKLQ